MHRMEVGGSSERKREVKDDSEALSLSYRRGRVAIYYDVAYNGGRKGCCQFALYFSVSGYISLACLFC